jgi:hypothetical protein
MSAEAVPATAFDAVTEFVERQRSGKLDADDRTIGRSHPLSLLVEATLESLSRGVLGAPIVGFSRPSENQLALERQNLEDRDEQPELQRLLYSFEGLAKVIRETGYSGSDPVVDTNFFQQLIPEWLEYFEDWAKASNQGPLAASIDTARQAYLTIAASIVG